MTTLGSDLVNSESRGLTKRQYFAVMAMQGMLSCPTWDSDQVSNPDRLGRSAVIYADALIEALSRTEDNDGR